MSMGAFEISVRTQEKEGPNADPSRASDSLRLSMFGNQALFCNNEEIRKLELQNNLEKKKDTVKDR
jgi:hypothetical protein